MPERSLQCDRILSFGQQTRETKVGWQQRGAGRGQAAPEEGTAGSQPSSDLGLRVPRQEWGRRSQDLCEVWTEGAGP